MPEEQAFLFEELDDSWEKEWVSMPECVNENLLPKYQIIINFECSADIKEFSELISQNLYETTKSVWYPKADLAIVRDRRYSDES